MLFNGSATLPPTTVRAGQATSLRRVNMTMRRSSARVRIIQGDLLVAWRVLAQEWRRGTCPMRVRRIAPKLLQIGETLDLEIVPVAKAPTRFVLRNELLPDAPSLGIEQVHVRTAPRGVLAEHRPLPVHTVLLRRRAASTNRPPSPTAIKNTLDGSGVTVTLARSSPPGNSAL